MLLVGPSLTVVPVTIHLSLREAIAALTTEEIVRTLRITAASMVRRSPPTSVHASPTTCPTWFFFSVRPKWPYAAVGR